jgi:hypothetical protein
LDAFCSCSGVSMTAERNPIRHAAARVRCSGVSMTANIVATPHPHTAATVVAGDLLSSAIGLSRDCAYSDFATIIGDSRLPFVALRLLFQKFFHHFFIAQISNVGTLQICGA